MHSVNWDDLRFVLSVSREPTLTGAGRALGVNQTTVARRLTALEQLLGTRLFDRIVQRWTPTCAGAIVVRCAEQMEADVLLTASQISGSDQSLSGRVRLTSVPAIVQCVLGPRVGALLDEFPGIELELIDSQENLDLTHLEADLAIRLARPTLAVFLDRVSGSSVPIPSNLTAMKTVLKQRFIGCCCTVTTVLVTPSAHAGENPISCADAVSQAKDLNASDLWRGAGECSEAGKERDTNFLLVAGQIRAMTDMNALEPATDDDGKAITELYGVLYYKAGGSGFAKVYRNADSFKQLSEQLDRWIPDFSSAYRPGWNFKPLADSADYGKMVACQKAFRLAKLNWYASLVQNDEYYTLNEQRAALKEKNPGGLKSGGDAANEYAALAQKIKAVSANFPPPTETPKACEGLNPK